MPQFAQSHASSISACRRALVPTWPRMSDNGKSLPGKSARGGSTTRSPRPSRKRATCRADHRCNLCGIHGLAENEFAGGRSECADFEHVVVSKGTYDEPSGDCLKCGGLRGRIWQQGHSLQNATTTSPSLDPS